MVRNYLFEKNREMKSTLHNKGLKNIKLGSKVAPIHKQKKP